jgi:acyl dehydratase
MQCRAVDAVANSTPSPNPPVIDGLWLEQEHNQMPGTLITEEIASLIGQETAPERNRFPISAEMAYDVADAIEDLNPLYVDADYAQRSRFGGLLCPPLAAWKDIAPPIGYFGAGQEWHFEVPLPFNSYGLNGGSDWQFLAPAFVGSWVTRQFRVLDIFEKQGRSGPLVFIVREETQSDQHGTRLSTAKRVSIHRALPAGEQPNDVALVSETLTTVPVAPPDPEVILAKPVPNPSAQRYFEDVAVGMDLPTVVKGPMTTTHLIRWAAANGNYARIHWDLPFAQLHQGLPNVVVNGSLKNQYLGQLLLDFAGEEGWFKRFYVQHRGMDFPGDTLTIFGTVTDTREGDGYGYVDCQVALQNDRGGQTASGTAMVVLPKRGQSLPLVWEEDAW